MNFWTVALTKKLYGIGRWNYDQISKAIGLFGMTKRCVVLQRFVNTSQLTTVQLNLGFERFGNNWKYSCDLGLRPALLASRCLLSVMNKQHFLKCPQLEKRAAKNHYYYKND
jgi:hypothetical protein